MQVNGRAIVNELRAEGIEASESAWAKLENALWRGRGVYDPKAYLARIMRYEETGAYVVERLPDQTTEEGRATLGAYLRGDVIKK